MFAGKARVTLTSVLSRKHFTYKLEKSDDGNVTFVRALCGSDNTVNGAWMYIGAIFADGILRAGKKGDSGWASFQALDWALKKLRRNPSIPDSLTIQHNDYCGRCGRDLTDPVSVETGFGPICRGLV
jgi:hypothetical protein